MDLYEQTKQLWDEKAAERAGQLARIIHAAEPEVEKAARLFREWKPLRFYLSVSGAAGTPLFSVRFCGQEVARLKVAPIPTLCVDPKHEDSNSRYFGLNTPVWKEGREWTSSDAAKFRAGFRRIADGTASGHVKEHAYELRILQELEKSDRKTKFAGSLSGVRPVLLSGFPFQCVLPISACKGAPRATAGHVDILTRRRGDGGRVRVGVWELKRPRVRSTHTNDSWDRKASGRAAGSPGRVRRWAVTRRRKASMDLRSAALAAHSSVTRIAESLTVT